ncbi:hypothetical protein NP006_23520, partial [Salmonella enterica]|nr:hypothetical protein [Salmonella enterica]
DKLVEIHEGTYASKVTKTNLELNNLSNNKMQDDESFSEESDTEEPKHRSFVALATIEQTAELESESEYESNAESERSHESEGTNQVSSLSKSQLCKLLKCMFKKLVKSEDQTNLLIKEVEHLKEQVNLNPLTNHIQEETSTQVEKLEEENLNLKGQVKGLKKLLERFTLGSKNLNLMLGSQRAVYNKSGLGYQTETTNKSFISIVNQHKKQLKAWVPKAYLTKQVGPNQYYVPKDKINYLTTNLKPTI